MRTVIDEHNRMSLGSKNDVIKRKSFDSWEVSVAVLSLLYVINRASNL